MRGADASIAPYASGPGYVLSNRLSTTVFVQDVPRTALWMPYGSSSEDANVGKMVLHASRAHNISVSFLVAFIEKMINGFALRSNFCTHGTR